MNKLYEENIALLNKQYNGMGNLIEKAKSELSENIELIEEHYADRTVLVAKKDGKTCYLNGKRNSSDPIIKWRENLGKLYPNAPVLMLGIGNWDYLQELIEYADNKITIVVYEPSITIFTYFLSKVSLKQWMEKQQIIFWVDGLEGMDEKRLEILIRTLLRYEVLNLSRRLIVPNYDVLFPEKTLAFVRFCRNGSKDEAVNRNTQAKFSSVMARNLLSNLKYMATSYKSIQFAGKIPADVPGIVVAAGPSLNKNIKELKKAKNKAFIVATDTAIKPLLAEGIVPDMMVIVDGKKPLSLIQTNGAEKIPLLSTIVAANEILEYHEGKKIFCDEGFGLQSEIYAHGQVPYATIPSGGSVATFAFSFLYMIGINTIILVGQDLAFTNNRSHADGTFEDKMPEVDTSDYIMVEGNNGEKVPTRDDFKLYLEWYERYIEGFKSENKNFRVINATEGGAKIKDTEVMTLADAIKNECKKSVDMEAIINSIPPVFDEAGQEWALEYVRKLPQKCEMLMRNTIKAKKMYEKLKIICARKKLNTNEYLSILKKLDRILQEIDHEAIYNLISNTLIDAQYILKNEQFMEIGDAREEGLEIARKGILYMDSVYECANVFKEYLEEINKDI